jgi:hypothetical protein
MGWEKVYDLKGVKGVEGEGGTRRRRMGIYKGALLYRTMTRLGQYTPTIFSLRCIERIFVFRQGTPDCWELLMGFREHDCRYNRGIEYGVSTDRTGNYKSK